MPTGIGGISGISGASLSTVRSWTTAAIAATSSTEISALTSAQVAVMSTAQVAAINTSGLSSLSTSTVSSLSVDQIFNLIVDQIAALTTKQVSNLKTSQLAALSTVQIKAIETVDLAAITTAQILALKTNQVASLTTAQVTALTTAQFGKLTSTQLTSLTTAQIKAIETVDLAAITTAQILALKTNQVASLTTAQVTALTTAQFNQLTTGQIIALATEQVRALLTAEIVAMSTGQISKLTSTQLAALTTTQIKAIEIIDLKAISTTQIGALTPDQLAALTTNQIAAMTTGQISNLSTGQLSGMTTTQFGAFSLAQVGALRGQIAGLIATPTQTWTRMLGSVFSDQAQSMILGADGAIYVSVSTQQSLDGQTSSAVSGEVSITKYMPDGTKSWTKSLGSNYSKIWESATGMTTGADGSIYVSGSTRGNLDGQTNNGESDVFITKYLPDGTKSWTRLLGTNSNEGASDMTTGADGSIYVSGWTWGNLDGQTKIGNSVAFIAKYLPDGTKSWTRLLGSDGSYSGGNALTSSTDGSIYVSGHINGNLDGQTNSGGVDAFIAKYLPDGTKSWTRLQGSNSWDEANSMTIATDGAIFISGFSSGAFDGETNSVDIDAFITKYLPDGTKSWTRLLGTIGQEMATSITTGADGSIYISGYTRGNLDGQQNNGAADGFVAKYLTDGTKSWTQLFGTDLVDSADNIKLAADDSIYLSGVTYGNLDDQLNSGYGDAFLTKYEIKTNTIIENLSTAQISGLNSDVIAAIRTNDIAVISTAQFRALTSSQIRALSTSQVAALSNLQIGSLTTAQLLSLTTSQVAALTTSAVAALTTMQIGKLTSAQLMAMSTKQIAAIETSDIRVLNSTQTSSLSSAQIKAVTTNQIASLTTAQLSALTTVQITYLRVDQVSSLVQDQVANMTTKQLASLTTAQISNLSNVSALRTSQIGSLTSAQLRQLGTLQMVTLMTAQVAAFSSVQIVSLKTDQIAALTTMQIKAIEAVDLKAITTVQIGAFTSDQLAALSTTQIAAMTTGQVNSLSTGQLSAMTTTQFGALSLTQVGALRGQIATISPPVKSWTRLLGSTSGDYASGMTIGADGSIYVSGETGGNLDVSYSNDADAFITKYMPDGTKSWTRLLASDSHDAAYGMTTGADGSIYVSGETSGNLDGQTMSGERAGFIAKYLPDGTKSWTRLLTSNVSAGAWGMTTGTDGSIYVSGTTDGDLDGQTNGGGQDAFITKYLPDGTKSWTRLIGSTSNDMAYGMTTGADGSIYVSGETFGNFDGKINEKNSDFYSEAFITKYLPDGTKSWTRLLGSNYDEDAYAYGMTTGADGSIYVCGMVYDSTEQPNNNYYDTFITKYLPDGTKSWSRLLGTIEWDAAISMTTGADGSIYICGETRGNLDGQPNSGNSDAFITKYLPDGTKSWTQLIGTNYEDSAYGMKSSADGSIYICGMTGGDLDGQHNNGSLDAFITKYETRSIISKFSTLQISALNTSVIAAISTKDMAAISTVQFRALSSSQIRALSTSQVAALSNLQISSLTTAQLLSLTTSQVAALTTSAVAALTTLQAASLTSVQIGSLTTSQIASMEAVDTASITTSAIRALTTAQVVALNSSQVSMLKTAQLAALSTVQLSKLETRDLIALTTAQIKSLSTSQLKGLTTDQIKAVTTAQKAALSSAQLNALGLK
jgi:uncharacterized delta-60 repeat protein